MQPENIKTKTAEGLFWGGLSNVLQQLLNLGFGIFLARKLSVSDYGIIGMLTIFAALSNALQEGGLAGLLIIPKLPFGSKKKAEQLCWQQIERVKRGDFSEAKLEELKLKYKGIKYHS